MRADNRKLQSGSYLGEDGIERFEDRYGRKLTPFGPGLRALNRPAHRSASC